MITIMCHTLAGLLSFPRFSIALKAKLGVFFPPAALTTIDQVRSPSYCCPSSISTQGNKPRGSCEDTMYKQTITKVSEKQQHPLHPTLTFKRCAQRARVLRAKSEKVRQARWGGDGQVLVGEAEKQRGWENLVFLAEH